MYPKKLTRAPQVGDLLLQAKTEQSARLRRAVMPPSLDGGTLAPLVSPDATQYELEAFDGSKSTAPAVTAELQFLGKSFRGQFLLVEGWHGVLGRNLLNNLSLVFDGPSRKWMERPSAP